MELNVVFTGYRPEKLPFSESYKDPAYLRFREAHKGLVEHLVRLGCTCFFSGVAKGFDTWAAEDVLFWKQTYPHIRLVCAVPFPGQADGWQPEECRRREQILAAADRVVTVCPQYRKGCYYERNRFMVDRSDVLVAAFDGKSGGTAYTVEYAQSQGLTVLQIDPSTAEIVRL